MSIFNYNPRHSHHVNVGNRPLGGDNPLRIQSMTTTATTTPKEVCDSALLFSMLEQTTCDLPHKVQEKPKTYAILKQNCVN